MLRATRNYLILFVVGYFEVISYSLSLSISTHIRTHDYSTKTNLLILLISNGLLYYNKTFTAQPYELYPLTQILHKIYSFYLSKRNTMRLTTAQFVVVCSFMINISFTFCLLNLNMCTMWLHTES